MKLSTEGVVTTLGLALAATVLLPAAKRLGGPVASVGVTGAGAVTDRLKGGFAYLKEEVEDIVAEAQWEVMRKKLDREING